ARPCSWSAVPRPSPSSGTDSGSTSDSSRCRSPRPSERDPGDEVPPEPAVRHGRRSRQSSIASSVRRYNGDHESHGQAHGWPRWIRARSRPMTARAESDPPRTADVATAAADIPSPAFEVGDGLGALQAVAEGTARGIGQEFLESLVRHLAEAFDVRFAVVAEFPGAPPLVRTLAFWERDRLSGNFEYALPGTPRPAA